jgi:hypothetical protein
VGLHYQPDVRLVSQQLPRGRGDGGSKAMIEAIAAFLALFSAGVFLAHAFDAYIAS